MTQLDPSDEHSTPTQVGHPGAEGGEAYGDRPNSRPSSGRPYGSQPYGNQPYASQPYASQPYASQPYASQPYASQPYASQPYGNQPYGPPGPPPRRRFGAGAVVGIVALIALLLAGLGTGAYFLLRESTPSDAASAAPTPARPAAPPAAPPAASAPAAPPTTVAPTADGTALSQVFTSSAGSGCGPYIPAAGEYVTSTGHQALEVRACAAGNDSVVYTRWDATPDAVAVVTDQAQTTRSVNGKDTWTMDGRTEGDYHEARQSDGTCRAFLDYRSGPYAVIMSAPTCSAVDQLFQDTTLPDDAVLPR